MIRPLNTAQLSSAKPRSGLTSIGDLLPKLMKMYELQAKAREQMESDRQRRSQMNSARANKQLAFAWYE